MELRYMGFHQLQNTRVYEFDGKPNGDSNARFAVTVDMALFLKHHVGIQEGPVLCAQKLTADLEANQQGIHELTNDDLLTYAAGRTAAEARRAEMRRIGPSRRKPEAGQQMSPWRR